MNDTLLKRAVEAAWDDNRRIVAPLMGFPGLQITKSNIKLAQQNCGEHYKTLWELARRYRPDGLFPLMDLSSEANALGRYVIFPRGDSATVVIEEYDAHQLELMDRINFSFDARIMCNVETAKMMSLGLPDGTLPGYYITGPYTLAALIMGAEPAAMATVLEPQKLHDLLEFCTECGQKYARMLVNAGVKMIGILEPSAVMLGPGQFDEFSVRYIKYLNDTLDHTDVATIYHICGNTMHLVDKMCDAGCTGLSLDAPETGNDFVKMGEIVDGRCILIGNTSPVGSLLTGTPQDVEREVNELCEAMDPYKYWILSTGCDIPEDTPLDNIAAFMEAGRNWRIKK